MIVSRAASFLRAANLLRPKAGQLQQKVRRSHDWYYRKAIEQHPRGVTLSAEIVAGFAWWWILWHIWTEPDHITGEFPFPDPSKWTDEELGIPDD